MPPGLDSPAVISLFAGAGGLDLGFHSAGFSTAIAYDKEAAAVKTFNANFGNDIAKVADISSLSADDISEDLKKCAHGRVVGVIGGPPCQGFSRGNVVKNPNDKRNRLPYAYARLIEALRRKYGIHFFVFENVAGLLQPSMARRWALIKTAFATSGFHLFPTLIDASNFDVPQHRKRLILVGLNKDYYSEDSFSFPDIKEKAKRTVFDAIHGLPEPQFLNRLDPVCRSEFHPNHWTMKPKSNRFTTGNFNRWRSFRLLDWNKPSPTVAYGNREIHIHPEGKRRLSVYEAMILQGFPSDFEMKGTFSQQVTQVCNAVPPPVAQIFAKKIYQIIYPQTNRQLRNA